MIRRLWYRIRVRIVDWLGVGVTIAVREGVSDNSRSVIRSLLNDSNFVNALREVIATETAKDLNYIAVNAIGQWDVHEMDRAHARIVIWRELPSILKHYAKG